MKIFKKYTLGLLIFFLVETLCVTFFLRLKNGMSFISILYTFSGISIALLILKNKFEVVPFQYELKNIYHKNFQYKIFISIIVLMVMYRFTKEYFLYNPLNYKESDMLPIIKVMCERFLSFKIKEVYAPIYEIWGGTKPIYLPALWMPFTLPTFLHIDIRWLSVSLFFLIFAYPIWRLNFNKEGSILLIASLFLLFWYLFSVEEANLIIYTEETVVITYYLLLAVSIIHQQKYLMAITITLCLFSRYAFIGWLPALLLFSIIEKNWKYIIIQGVFILLFFYFFLVYPFGTQLIADSLSLPNRYIEFSSRVWKDSPSVFTEGLGFAKFFGQHFILLQHQMLIGFSLLLPTLYVGILVWLRKKYLLHKTAILLSSLKVSLVLFYTFIDVPYTYLFYTSSFLTMIIVMHAAHEQPNQANSDKHLRKSKAAIT
jgi:hypothetical protein